MKPEITFITLFKKYPERSIIKEMHQTGSAASFVYEII